jgi:CRP-like cAMP-binding protein
MLTPFARKLGAYTQLSDEDQALLDRVTSEHTRHLGAREDIVAEGRPPHAINVFETGWGCRYKTLEDGRRQIVGLFLPGDMCDLNVYLLSQMDHSIGALTAATISEISRSGFDELMTSHPRIRSALWWEQLVAGAIQREWSVNLGQRTALERLAHLLCEVFYRLRVVGLTDGDRCDFPLTQTELGEATGLSTVHVNRTLQELRAANLIILKDRTLQIPDLEELEDVAMFDPAYLHLEHEGRHLDANRP